MVAAVLVRFRDVQRTAPIADLALAVREDGGDGSIPPDVAALARIGTVVMSPARAAPCDAWAPLSFGPGLRAWAAHAHDEQPECDQCED